jgi:glycosyltransferase involved in cell wall biosynthesis
VHHGVTDRPRARKALKPKFGWTDRHILLMSGLMSEGKGIEYVIQALPEIVKQHPETIFVVVGQTHPNIVALHGEAYRESLVKLAEDLGVSDHLELVNEYLPLEELLEYYEACDIYLTPHLDPQQVSSGTLAYAIGMGKASISTPYIYAKEMLSNDRGVLVDFRNSEQISEAVCKLFANPHLMQQMEQRAYTLGRTMSWPRVAERYLNLFRVVLDVQDAVINQM